MVRHGLYGLLYLPRDTQDLAYQMQTILQILADKLAQMGRESRQLVEERFVEQLVIDAYLQVLDELC